LQVHLLRHGIAEDPRLGLADRDRALIPEGRRKLKEVIRLAAAAGVSPGLILTSPYRRAVETAHVAREILGHGQELVTVAALVPGGDPEEVWTDIRALREEQLLLVSHEPLCGRLLGYLLGQPGLDVDFKKGAMARVDLLHTGSAPRGVLQWMLTAKIAEAVRGR